jgi:hypothetical protein
LAQDALAVYQRLGMREEVLDIRALIERLDRKLPAREGIDKEL